MASDTSKRRRWIKALLWAVGGFIIFRVFFSNGGLWTGRLADPMPGSNAGLEAAEPSPMAVDSGGQWLMSIIQAAIAWIGSLVTVAIVFAVIAIAVMVLTDWGGNRR